MQILKSTGKELRVGELDNSPQGLVLFERTLKINKNLTALTKLDLSDNNMGAMGVQSLVTGNLTNFDDAGFGGKQNWC